MITINLIKDDPVVRRRASLQRAQEKYSGSDKSRARLARYREAHLEERREADRAAKKRERERSPEKLRERHRLWRSENYEKALESVRRAGAKWRSTKGLMQKYGLTPETLAELLVQQGSKCPICDEDLRIGKDSAIDHDHNKPGTCRGVLCRRCNLALGQFEDSPSLLESAARYLRERGFYGDR